MGMSGNFLSYIKGLNDPFEAQDGRWDFSRDAAAEKALRGECPDFSRVAAGNFGFLSSYTRDLRDHLVGPQESTVSMQVERGLSGFIIIQVLGPRSSSGVEAGTSGFLSSADMDLGVPLEFQQGSQASSLVVTWKSAFLLSYKSSFKVPVELT